MQGKKGSGGRRAGSGRGKSTGAGYGAGGAAADPAAARAADEAAYIKVLRSSAQQYLRLPNVTSVGVGYRMKAGKPTDELTIQFTVARKLEKPALEAVGLTALPRAFKALDGTRSVPVDVVERSFKASYTVAFDPDAPPADEPMTREEARAERRARLGTLVPGVSIGHYAGSAGTLGMIVYDRATGQPLALSNWHVLQGPGGRIGDAIVQPGPFDDGDVNRNVAGRLVRSHLGVAGDCAVATIEGRRFGTDILELGVTPRRVARVNLGDPVVKSGRTTGVTRGFVSRVGVVANINYGGLVGVQQIGGFEVRPYADQPPPPDGEISMGGDSGSPWMIDPTMAPTGPAGNAVPVPPPADGDDDDVDDGADVVVGLHFGGETDPDPAAEHALACNIDSVLDKLKVSVVDPTAAGTSDRERWEAVNARIGQLMMRVLAAEQQGGGGRAGGCSCGGGGGGGGGAAAAMAGAGGPGAEAVGDAFARLGFPIYGNWCGPRYGSGTPVDGVDRACMNHDNCYGRRGYFDCGCDAQLIAEINQALASGDVRFAGRFMGPLIREYFRLQPCANHAAAGGGAFDGGAAGGAFGGAVGGGAAGMVPGVPPGIRDTATPKVWNLGGGDRGPG